MDAKHGRYPSNLDNIATAEEQSVCALSNASPDQKIDNRSQMYGSLDESGLIVHYRRFY